MILPLAAAIVQGTLMLLILVTVILNRKTIFK